MTAAYGVTARRRLGLRRQWQVFMARGLSREARIAVLLGVASIFATAGMVGMPEAVPLMVLGLPLLLGSIFLGPRTLPWFVVFLMVLLTVGAANQPAVSARVVVSTVVVFAMGAVVLAASLRRTRLGVAGVAGESMFVDLRDRIQSQGGLPPLPPGWQVESALHSAGGTPFAGDFVVASADRPDRLEVAVVDVSGKGADAGTRALLLSGAFGGLLGALPPGRFLPAANGYLLRQDWAEGFATAIHLSLDLDTGDYQVRAAGHPPAVHRHAGSGRWSVLRTEGPVLGLLDGASFRCVTGRLAPGDAVLLYTDGMVEEPRRDIDLGIDRMLGEAESLLRGSFEGAAARLASSLGSPDDDRAMVVVHRR